MDKGVDPYHWQHTTSRPSSREEALHLSGHPTGLPSFRGVTSSAAMSPCPHGRQKSRCKECSGSGICQHRRLRSRCKECGGGSICEHGKERSRCKPCGGGSICHHGRERSQCKACGGSSICEHGRQRVRCKECGGGSICEHGRERRRCKACVGLGRVKIKSAKENGDSDLSPLGPEPGPGPGSGSVSVHVPKEDGIDHVVQQQPGLMSPSCNSKISPHPGSLAALQQQASKSADLQGKIKPPAIVKPAVQKPKLPPYRPVLNELSPMTPQMAIPMMDPITTAMMGPMMNPMAVWMMGSMMTAPIPAPMFAAMPMPMDNNIPSAAAQSEITSEPQIQNVKSSLEIEKCPPLDPKTRRFTFTEYQMGLQSTRGRPRKFGKDDEGDGTRKQGIPRC